MQEPVWKNRSREERIRFYEQSRPQNIRQKKQKRQVKRLRQAASVLMVIAAFFAGIAVIIELYSHDSQQLAHNRKRDAATEPFP